MRRWYAVVVLILAILVAGQSILHNHPAIPAAAGGDLVLSAASVVPCAICATANARVLVTAPEIAAPAPAIEDGVVPAVPGITAVAISPLSSRAPPSA